MTFARRFSLTIGISLFLFCIHPGSSAQAAPATQPAADTDALEQQFIKTMTNAVLVGRFTTEGNNRAPAEERYTIVSVKKIAGDLWLISARIQFGNKDATIPLPIPVRWAGDTPVLCVTDMGVPGIGTYSARVLIYDDHYAGTWSGSATHRGSLFGKIEHAAATQPVEK
jgi:hypothetical protein